MSNPRIQLAVLIAGTILLGVGTPRAEAGQARSSDHREPIKRFVTIPIESMDWCDATAEDFRQRVAGAKIGKAFTSPNQSKLVNGYWIDTADGGSIGLACFDKTAIVVGQRNHAHTEKGSFMGTVERYGPQCRILEHQELFFQDRGVTVFWTHRYGADDVIICMPGTGSISLSRVRG